MTINLQFLDISVGTVYSFKFTLYIFLPTLTFAGCFAHNFLHRTPNELILVLLESRLKDLSNYALLIKFRDFWPL